MHGAPIEDYCLIGDCETAALVSRDGSIDWLCWPTFSSGACFAALLGTRDHGYWKIAPAAELKDVSRTYIADTLIVETTFVTRSGEVSVTDFMPPRGTNSHLIRIVRGVRGRVKMRMEIAIRFDYGRTVPWVTRERSVLRAVAGGDMIVLRTRAPLHGEGLTTVSEFTVGAGQTMSFTLSSSSSLAKVPPALDTAKALKQTKRFWTEWSHRTTYHGRYADAVNRSMITLKALTYRPSGGIVAAPTTSLPEKIGGTRNWDYRFCWLRDTSFTLLALMQGGYHDEAVAWRQWLLRAIAGAPDQVQTIYGIWGERQVPEWEADWLPGYRHSRPVRVGNAAVGQFQLDVFGEVAAALDPHSPGERRHSRLCQRIAGNVDRPPLRCVAATGRGYLGDARRPQTLHALEGDGVGRARPRHPLSRALRRWRRSCAMEEESRAHPPRGLREGLQQAAEQLRAIVRLNRAGRFLPAHRVSRLPSCGRSAHSRHRRSH